MRLFRCWLQTLKLRIYRRRIEKLLALHDRGEVRCDGLRLNRLRNRLELQWRARDVHPWDRTLSAERRAKAFLDQATADTEAVIERAFESMPQVDVIDLAVIDPASEVTIISGAVDRSVWAGMRSLRSARMRLMELGVRYCIPDDAA